MERIREADWHTVLQPYLGQAVDLVLKNGETVHATLLGLTETSARLQDSNARWYNRKRHRQEVPYSKITELLITETSAY